MNQKQKSVIVRAWMEENQGKHICQCGCGGIIVIKIHHSARGIPKFLDGHCSKISNSMKGRSGDKNPNYKSGRYISQDGYVLILVPGPGRSEYKLEHRMVVEDALGIVLEENEDVHHINGDKTDNRIENLKIMLNSEHTRFHAKRGESGFGLMVKRYGPNWKKELFGEKCS